MIRVLLAEDQAMVRGAIAALLTLEGDIEIVAEVGNGNDVVPAALTAKPDVALLDIEMPGCDGISAAAALHARLPSCRVLILTTFGRPGYLRKAMESGVVGFLLKDAPSAQLAAAIRRVIAGERVVDPRSPWPRSAKATTRSLSASAQCWPRPAVEQALPRSPPRSSSPKAPSGTISPSPSRNWACVTGSKLPISPSKRAGFKCWG